MNIGELIATLGLDTKSFEKKIAAVNNLIKTVVFNTENISGVAQKSFNGTSASILSTAKQLNLFADSVNTAKTSMEALGRLKVPVQRADIISRVNEAIQQGSTLLPKYQGYLNDINNRLKENPPLFTSYKKGFQDSSVVVANSIKQLTLFNSAVRETKTQTDAIMTAMIAKGKGTNQIIRQLRDSGLGYNQSAMVADINALKQAAQKAVEIKALMEKATSNTQNVASLPLGVSRDWQAMSIHVGNASKQYEAFVKTQIKLGKTYEYNGKIYSKTHRFLAYAGNAAGKAALQMVQAGKSVDKFGDVASRSLEKGEKTWVQYAKGLAAGMVTYRVLLSVGQAIAGSFRTIITEAIDFEDQMQNIRKVIKISEPDFIRLGKQLRELSLSTGLPVKELTDIARGAAQFGVANEGLAQFTDTIARIKILTDSLSVEEATMMLAKFANIAGTSTKDFVRIGSALEYLSNTSQTTDKEILALSLRLVSAGKEAQMTEGQILGIGSAAASVGLQARMGGTAISRAIIDITRAVATGSDKLKIFAKLASRVPGEFTPEKFKQVWQSGGAANLFAAIIKSLGEFDKASGKTTLTLDRLGWGERNTRDSLTRLAYAQNDMTESLVRGEWSWKNFNYLTEQANKRLDSVKQRANLFKQAVLEIARTMGEKLLVVWDKFLSGLLGITEAIRNPTLAMRAFTAAVIGLSVAFTASKIAKIFREVEFGSQVIRSFSKERGMTMYAGITGLSRELAVVQAISYSLTEPTVIGKWKSLGGAIKGAAHEGGVLGTIFRMLGGLGKFLISPTGLFTLAVIGAAYFIDKNEELKKQVLSDWEDIKEEGSKIWGSINKFIYEAIHGAPVTSAEATAKMKSDWEKFGGWFTNYFKDLSSFWASFFISIGEQIRQVLAAFSNDVERGVKEFNEASESLKVAQAKMIVALLPDKWLLVTAIKDYIQRAEEAKKKNEEIGTSMGNWEGPLQKTKAELEAIEEEQERNYEAFMKALKPADALAKEMSDLLNAKIAPTENQVIKKYALDLVDAVDKQKEFKETLSDTTKYFYSMARAYLVANPSQEMTDWVRSIKEKNPFEEFSVDLEKVKADFIEFSREAKEILNPDQFVGDYDALYSLELGPEVRTAIDRSMEAVKEEYDIRSDIVRKMQEAYDTINGITNADNADLVVLSGSASKRKEITDRITKAHEVLSNLIKVSKEDARIKEEDYAASVAAHLKNFTTVMEEMNLENDKITRKRLDGLQVENNIREAIKINEIERLQVTQDLLSLEVPFTELQSRNLQLRQIALDNIIRKEEIELRYAEERERLEKLLLEDIEEEKRQRAQELLNTGLEKRKLFELNNIQRRYNAELLRMQQEEYLQLIEIVKNGSGEFFDAITKGGKSAFSNLLDWIKDVFLSKLRTLFQNLFTGLFTGKLDIGTMLNGIIPASLISKINIKGTQTGTIAEQAQSLLALGSTGGNAEYMAAINGQSVGQYATSMGVPALMAGNTANLNAFGLTGAKGQALSGALIAGGSTLFLDSLNREGVGGWIESILGGASTGAGIGAMFGHPVIGAAIGAFAGAVTKFGQWVGKLMTGPNTYEAAAKEIARDYAGVQMSAQQVQELMTQAGIPEDKAWDLRKNITMSPLFMQQTAELAKQQGKYAEFLKDLETEWGGVGYKEAVIVGELTGDWSKLNKIWSETINLDADIEKIIPGASKNLLLGDTVLEDWEQLIVDMHDLQNTIKNSIPTTKTLFETFANEGKITEEFSKQITDLGGDIQKFQTMADLTELNSNFEEMVQHFRDTGEILPDLAKLFEEFGGDMEVLQNVSQLEGLHKSLDFIDNLVSDLKSLAPELDPLTALMNGKMSADVIQALTEAGLDPEKFSKLAEMINLEKNWNYEPFTTLTPALENALKMYGGTAGQTAIERYYQGYNTITEDLLNNVKTAMDQAYLDQIKELVTYAEGVGTTTSDKITTLTYSVETELSKVSTNITEAINNAKQAVCDEIDRLINAIANAESIPTTPVVEKEDVTNLNSWDFINGIQEYFIENKKYLDSIYNFTTGFVDDLMYNIENKEQPIPSIPNIIEGEQKSSIVNRKTASFTNFDMDAFAQKLFRNRDNFESRKEVVINNPVIWGFKDFVEECRKANVELKVRNRA